MTSIAICGHCELTVPCTCCFNCRRRYGVLCQATPYDADGVPTSMPTKAYHTHDIAFKKLYPGSGTTYSLLERENPGDPRIVRTDKVYKEVSAKHKQWMNQFKSRYPATYLRQVEIRKAMNQSKKKKEKKGGGEVNSQGEASSAEDEASEEEEEEAKGPATSLIDHEAQEVDEEEGSSSEDDASDVGEEEEEGNSQGEEVTPAPKPKARLEQAVLDKQKELVHALLKSSRDEEEKEVVRTLFDEKTGGKVGEGGRTSPPPITRNAPAWSPTLLFSGTTSTTTPPTTPPSTYVTPTTPPPAPKKPRRTRAKRDKIVSTTMDFIQELQLMPEEYRLLFIQKIQASLTQTSETNEEQMVKSIQESLQEIPESVLES